MDNCVSLNPNYYFLVLNLLMLSGTGFYWFKRAKADLALKEGNEILIEKVSQLTKTLAVAIAENSHIEDEPRG